MRSTCLVCKKVLIQSRSSQGLRLDDGSLLNCRIRRLLRHFMGLRRDLDFKGRRQPETCVGMPVARDSKLLRKPNLGTLCFGTR